MGPAPCSTACARLSQGADCRGRKWSPGPAWTWTAPRCWPNCAPLAAQPAPPAAGKQPGCRKTAADSARYTDVVARNDAEVTAAFEPLWLPFDHPLWIVYSSGTMGLPKPIVHSAWRHRARGAMLTVCTRYRPGRSYAANSLGERFCWVQLHRLGDVELPGGGLLSGTTCVIFDGSPGGRARRKPTGARCGALRPPPCHLLAQSATHLPGCMKAGVDLSHGLTCRAFAGWAAPARSPSAEVQQ